MGSGGLSANQLRGDQHEVLLLLMPVYYVKDCVVKQEDIDLVKIGWNKIVKDQAEPYLKLKASSENAPTSCISWFYTCFYERLFDIHPLCKPLFTTGLVSQGTFLVKMISITLKQLGDPDNFQKIMEGLALRHCQKGVKAVEYGIVGDVLFHTMARVEGPNEYTAEVHMSWRKIYSAMLRIILPLCIQYEKGGANQITRDVTEKYLAPTASETTETLEVH